MDTPSDPEENWPGRNAATNQMSWTELLSLIEGDPTALEAYLQEHPDLGPERYAYGKIDAHERAARTGNFPALTALARYQPLTPAQEDDLAETLATEGLLGMSMLPFLSPLAAAYGAMSVNDLAMLGVILPRISPKDMAHLLHQVAQCRHYVVLQYLIDHVQAIFPEDKSHAWSNVLLSLNFGPGPIEDGLADVVAKLIWHGARLAPTNVRQTTRTVLMGMDWENPGSELVRLLRALYGIGAGEYLPPYILDRLFQDEGAWLPLRSPALWDRLPRNMAAAAERNRRTIQRTLMATVGNNLTQYVLEAI